MPRMNCVTKRLFVSGGLIPGSRTTVSTLPFGKSIKLLISTARILRPVYRFSIPYEYLLSCGAQY